MKKFIASILALLLFSTTAFALPQFQADSNIKVTSTIVANNTTAIIIKATSGTVYLVEVANNNAVASVAAYVKLYNATTATCGSGTPQARYMIPGSTTANTSAAVAYPILNGDAYGLGIVMCITTGIADNDTTAPAASQYIVNIHFK
jgi:hypothetical protein